MAFALSLDQRRIHPVDNVRVNALNVGMALQPGKFSGRRDMGPSPGA